VSIIDGPQTPSALFFTHGSLETGNGETQYSINRASQDIVCNAKLSSVQLVLNDVRFEYVPDEDAENWEEDKQFPSKSSSSSTTSIKTVEYHLKTVDVPGVGCYEADAFRKANSMDRDIAKQSYENFPFIGRGNAIDERSCSINENLLHSTCSDSLRGKGDHVEKDENQLIKAFYELIKNPIGRVSLVSTLQSHHKLTCSFYIGIFEAEVMEMYHEGHHRVISNQNSDDIKMKLQRRYHNKNFFNFNKEELEVLWPMGDHEPIGEYQESLSLHSTSGAPSNNHEVGLLIWTHVSVKSVWSRRAALRFLSLMKGDVSELDFFSSSDI
jgi:hypothetical protein